MRTTEGVKVGSTETAGNFILKLTPEIVAAQGKNDREYLTLRVKLLLEAMEKNPRVSINEIAKLAGTAACGQGCCCCCPPGTCCSVPGIAAIEPVEERVN